MTWVINKQLVNYGGKTAVKIRGNEALVFENEIKKFPNDYFVSFSEKLGSRVYEICSNELKEIIWEKGKLVNLMEKEDMVKSSFFVLIEAQEEAQKIGFQDGSQIKDNKGKEVEKIHSKGKAEKEAEATNLESVENELKELKRQHELGEISDSQFKEKLVKLEGMKQKVSKQEVVKEKSSNKNNDNKGNNVGAYFFGSSVFLSLLLILMFAKS